MLCYRVTLGTQWDLRTSDVDLAVELIVSGKTSGLDLEKVMEKAGAIAFFSSRDGFRRFSIEGLQIEFIAHDQKRSRQKESELVKIPDLNISALPLPFIRMLLDFSERVGSDEFYFKIPIPEAFFFHKLIIAQRRQREPKRAKDLSQCQALVPFIRTEKLQQVMESQRIGKDTKKKIVMSCKMIDFDFDRLET